MQYVQVRFHGLLDEKIELVNRLKEYSDVCVGYQHLPDQGCAKPHLHFLLANFKKSKTTFYSWCKSYGLTADEYWFSYFHSKKCQCCKGKNKVDMSFITYESKGNLEPVGGLKGVSVEEVGEWRSRWVDRTVQTQLRFVGETTDGSVSESVPTQTDTKRCTKKMLLNEMLARVDKMEDKSDDCILDVIRAVLVANGEPIGVYKVLDFRDSIVMHAVPDTWTSEVLGMISKRNSRY